MLCIAKNFFIRFLPCIMQISKIISDRIINIKQLKTLSQLRKNTTNTGALGADIFESAKGLLGIRNVRSGDYGAICDGSKPLKSFYEVYDAFEHKALIKRGYSTNTDGFAPAFLKSKAIEPLSTSKVHDCSVAYFYNELEDTHFLYHIYPDLNAGTIKSTINTFMPEGFQKAIIVPGDNAQTKVHQKSLPKIFEVIREINPETKLEVFHNSSRLPEIVGFNGNVYEIRNTQHVLGWHFGQASFHLSDVRDVNTIDKINNASDINALEDLRTLFLMKDYDPEIQKVLNNLIDARIKKLHKT